LRAVELVDDYGNRAFSPLKRVRSSTVVGFLRKTFEFRMRPVDEVLRRVWRGASIETGVDSSRTDNWTIGFFRSSVEVFSLCFYISLVSPIG
jgi:hypothetical protein